MMDMLSTLNNKILNGMIIVLVMVITVSLLSKKSEANVVYIDQSGSNFDLTIIQDGDNNSIGTSSADLNLRHDNNTLYFYQEGEWNEIGYVSYWGSGASWGGDLDGSNNSLSFYQRNTLGTSSSSKNKIGFHIPSSGNDVIVCQGWELSSISDTTCGDGIASEYGGHTVNLDLHNGDNTLRIGQQTGTGDADHYAQIYTYGGDNNNIFVQQRGNGNKWLSLTVRTDDGDQNIKQRGDGAHTATIDLYGTYKTDLDLTQNSSSDLTYTLNQNCQTSGGCTIDVTQN
jgi:hypothetical protein